MDFTNIHFSFSVAPTPWEEEDCVQEILGTIPDVGTITVLKVQTGEAVNRQYSLFDVFDSHSDLLAAIYQAIFDPRGMPREDLEIQGGWDDVLILWSFDFKPEFRGVLVQAFETAITTFGGQSIVVAVPKRDDSLYDGLDLSVDEWRQLAFVKIGGSPFLFRDNCRLSPYRDADPG